MKQGIEITGVWLRRRGLKAQLLVEFDGKWHLCSEEMLDGMFSHITEPSGIKGSPLDPVTEKP